MAYCLDDAGIGPGDLDFVVFYDKPLKKLDRLFETFLSYAPRGFRSFRRAIPRWLQHHLQVSRELDKALGGSFTGRFLFAEHHLSHAASAFYPSPFDNAAILTLDGVGEWATAAVGVGHGNRIELHQEQRFPHSLGLLYSAFTYHAGFRVNSGEYKLMGLAPYGEPRYRNAILDELVDLKPDGSLRLDMSYFRFAHGLTMTSRKFDRLMGGRPRRPGSPLTQREMDLAASIQAVTEEAVLRSARHAQRVSGEHRLCLAGGVALNCVSNGRLQRAGVFDEIWIQPAAGDAGGALGAALYVWYELLGNAREADGVRDAQRGSLLGPAYDDPGTVRDFFDDLGATYRELDGEDALLDEVAELLVAGRVVGFFQGRMEFGPRALGSRSILADPRQPEMLSTINRKVKFRESFRPLAPSVLMDDAADWFDLPGGVQSPYMMLVAPVHERHRLPDPLPGPRVGLERLLAPRSSLPAVTHVDGSARVQTVDAERHGRFYRLLERFKAKTGCPVLLNTSFNVRGEPIVCTPADAYRCFMATDLDALVVADFVLLKGEQAGAEKHDLEAYRNAFELD